MLEAYTSVLSSPHIAILHSLPRTGGATGAELPPGAALRVRMQDPRLARPIRVLGSADESAGMASQTIRPKLSDCSKAFDPRIYNRQLHARPLENVLFTK